MEMDTSEEHLDGKLSIKAEIKQENDVLPNRPQQTDPCVRDEPWLVDLNKVKCELENLDDENETDYLVTDSELKTLTSLKTEGLEGKSDGNGPEREHQIRKRGPPKGPDKACEFCGKTFRDSHKLKKHVMDHTGERPFKCELCSSAFKEKYNLSVHIKTHTELATDETPSTSSTKAKRKCFSIEEKRAIVTQLERGKSNAKLAEEFGVSRSTISTIWGNRAKIVGAFNANERKAKKLRASQHDDLDRALLEWFKKNRGDDVGISGPILRRKANEFSLLLGKENFQCSESWISRFKARHNIVFGKVNVDPADIPVRLAETWTEMAYKEMRKGYKDEEIFNAHEIGLLYRATLEETTKYKGGTCTRGELSKERITALAATNLTGTQKRDLLVIGNAKNPTFFDIAHLPVTYENNSRAWMTPDAFVRFLRKWDAELSGSSKKILLIVDSSPAHPNVDDLKAVKLAFLPPSCTSALRPFDQGVARSLKTNYRRRQVREAIQNVELGNGRKLTILDAILTISQAWDDVTSATIRSGFKSAGFVAMDQKCDETTEERDEDNIPLSEWVKVYQNTDFSTTRDDLEEFVNVDNDLATCGDIANDTVGASVAESDDIEGVDSDIEVPSYAQALQAICMIKKIVTLEGIKDGLLADNIVTVERKIERLYYQLKCKERGEITDSFSS